MINFLRRLMSSKVGVAVALAFLALVALAFAAQDVSGIGNGARGGSNAAKVGKTSISAVELQKAVARAFEEERKNNPQIDMATFVRNGGVDDVLRAMVDATALDEYAKGQGMGVSKRMIDARILTIPAFTGVTGGYDSKTMQAVLARNGVTPNEFRNQLAQEMLREQFLAPVAGRMTIPATFATPYASLQLESRIGKINFVPAAQHLPTTEPTDAQLTAYYNANKARYTVPEQRTLRYAMLDTSKLAAPAVTDAQIEEAYKANAARFAASEKRHVTQVIVGTEDVANQIAAKVRGGTSLAAAAQAAGLSSTNVETAGEQAYAAQTDAAAAKAVFAANQGDVVGPIKAPLGFLIVKVNSVAKGGAQTLAQATPMLRAELTEKAKQDAGITMFNTVQDSLNNGASVEEIARQHNLEIQTTPAMTADGRIVGQAAQPTDKLVAALLAPAFQAGDGDGAQLVPVVENKLYAIVDVTKIVPAAPQPLATIRNDIAAAYKLQEGNKTARGIARKIADAVHGGAAFDAAVRSGGGTPGATQQVGARRIQLSQAEQQGQAIPPEMLLLFQMAPKTAKTLELPNNRGWLVIYLDQQQQGNVTQAPQLVTALQNQMQNLLPSEYVASFIAAARQKVGVSINPAVVDALKRNLSGADQPAN